MAIGMEYAGQPVELSRQPGKMFGIAGDQPGFGGVAMQKPGGGFLRRPQRLLHRGAEYRRGVIGRQTRLVLVAEDADGLGKTEVAVEPKRIDIQPVIAQLRKAAVFLVRGKAVQFVAEVVNEANVVERSQFDRGVVCRRPSSYEAPAIAPAAVRIFFFGPEVFDEARNITGGT